MRASSRLRGIGLAAALVVSASSAPQDEPETVDLGGESVSLSLPELEGWKAGETDEQLKGSWAGRRG